MMWEKLGLLYSVMGVHPKMLSHASNPVAVHLNDSVYRVYFSARDELRRSSVGAVDVDIVERRVVKELTTPLFEFGEPNSFYSHGLSIGDSYQVAGKNYILFMGWKNNPGEHWYGQIGRLLVSESGGLSLDSDEPFLGLDEQDPISLSYPCVYEQGNRFHMWYGSTASWGSENGEMIHILKHATSEDGVLWVKNSTVIPYQIGVAQAFSRPTAWVDRSGQPHLWFSFRSGLGEPYRIGYASYIEGDGWVRHSDGPTLEPSQIGWDSNMVEYPFVFEHQEQIYMLYNGSEYGKSGFGLAVLRYDL